MFRNILHQDTAYVFMHFMLLTQTFKQRFC